MASRLTDTTIWKKQKWFKKLSIEYKLAWKYLTDECNHAGIWKIDITELLEDLGVEDFDFDDFLNMCNKDFDKKTGKGVIRQRVMKFNDDFVWITGFMSFQYGGKTQIIKKNNNAVPSAIDILNSFSLYDLGIKMRYFKMEEKATPSKGDEAPQRELKGEESPLRRVEGGKDKDIDKDILKEGSYDNTTANDYKGEYEHFNIKIHGFKEIPIAVFNKCESWQLKELKNFITHSQQNFESIVMNTPLLNNEDNFKIVVQEFVNMIQRTNDYQESSSLRRFFGNWIGKKNGSLGTFILECKDKDKGTDGRKNINTWM